MPEDQAPQGEVAILARVCPVGEMDFGSPWSGSSASSRSTPACISEGTPAKGSPPPGLAALRVAGHGPPITRPAPIIEMGSSSDSAASSSSAAWASTST